MLDKRKNLGFLAFLLLILISCTVQKKSEGELIPIKTNTTTEAQYVPTAIVTPTITPETIVEVTSKAQVIPVEIITPTTSPPTVLEPIIKVTYLTDYLGFVFPEPGSEYIITSEAYLEVLSGMDYFLKDPSICVGVGSFELMEKGDSPSTEKFLSQMYIVVDGIEITNPNLTSSYDILGIDRYDLETGEFLFRTPDGEDFIVCWPADFSRVGIHTATFFFTKTSGKVESYTWSFIIKE